MSFNPDLPIDVYVCFGVERGTKFPHWMLMLRSRDAMTGTWYHTIGGPTQNRPYQVTIQANKRVNSHGIASMEFLGTLYPKDVNKVNAAAKRIPPQQCQTYVVSLIAELENRGLLPPGNAIQLNDRVQMSILAREYRDSHPVPPPSISQGSSSRATYVQYSYGEMSSQAATSLAASGSTYAPGAASYEMVPSAVSTHASSQQTSSHHPPKSGSPPRFQQQTSNRLPGTQAHASAGSEGEGCCCIIM